MTYFIHYRDPRSTEIEKYLETIPKCPGTCIFIDIVDSTHIKYQTDLRDWGKRLNNTFNFISILNEFPSHIVKGIGDEMMLFVPDEDLRSRTNCNNYYALLEEIYATLYNIKYFPGDDLFLQAKVAIHYCTEVYNITFLKKYNDYYGIDVDLSARLMLKAKANRIVMSEKYYSQVQNALLELKLPEKTGCLEKVSEKYVEDFKGVPHVTGFRIIDV
jgi:class 3 adenylate cyclase